VLSSRTAKLWWKLCPITTWPISLNDESTIEYRKRVVRIAENTLPNIHPDLISYHIALAKILYDIKQRDLR
jgi:hypothetical protein